MMQTCFRHRVATTGIVLLVAVTACTSRTPAPSAGSGDQAFQALAAEIIDDALQRSPTNATYLGIHKYDERLESFAAGDLAASVTRAKAFRQRLDTVDPATLSLTARLD